MFLKVLNKIKVYSKVDSTNEAPFFFYKIYSILTKVKVKRTLIIKALYKF